MSDELMAVVIEVAQLSTAIVSAVEMQSWPELPTEAGVLRLLKHTAANLERAVRLLAEGRKGE